MTLAVAPHPPSVFRYLKQAWREWVATGNAETLTVNTPATQPAANPITVTGTILVDRSIPLPVQLQCNMFLPGNVLSGTIYGYADKTTGAYALTFAAGVFPVAQVYVSVLGPARLPVFSSLFNLT